MFCAYCGKQNANAFGYCNACGKPLVPVAGAAPAMAPYPQLESPKTMHPLGWVAIAATAGLGVFVAATWVVPSGTDAAPFRLGVFIGATLPALIAAFLAGGIKKWRSPNRFAVVCFLVGIAWTSLVWVGSQVNHETPEAQIKRLFLEASGRQPIKRAFWAKDRAFDDTFRAFFRKILDLNREYGEKANQIDSNEISKVGAVESFVNPDYRGQGDSTTASSLSARPGNHTKA